MKDRRTDLVLTLDNLNCEESRDSPYVLTSPRSLQACKIVRVKPIELLYRSVDEVRQQLSTFATLDRVLHVYQQQEKTRRSKLELCRAVRDQLVSFSTPNESSSPSPASSIKENLNPSPPSLLIPQDNQDSKRSLTPIGVLKSSKRSISPINSKRSPSPSVSFKRSPSPVTTKRAPSPGDSTFTSRKQQLDRENKARARDVATVHEEALKAVENRLVAPINNKVTASRSRSPCQSSRSRGQQQLPAVRVSSASSSSNRKRSRSRKSTVASRGNVRAATAEGFHPTVLPSLSRRPTSRSSGDTSGRPKSGTSSSSTASTATRLASAGRRVSSATSARGVSGAVGGRTSRTRACAARWTNNTDSNNNSSTGSTGGGGTSKRTASALQQLSGWLADGVSVPEHDRRILESMALRREEERNAEELAHKAHLTWEMERVLREQELWEQSAHRIRDLEEKRRMEGAHNERKLAELRERESRSQQRLQQTLLEKEARSAAVLRSAGDRKGEQAEACERQKAAVVWAREQLQKEGMLWRHAIQQGQFERLQRAEQARLKVKEVTRRRVASANRVEELRHAERHRMVQAETEETLRLLRAKCREKEERALILLQRTSGEREKQIRGLSEARASRQQNAREMHRELEAGLARWREQCAALQREASERAERRAAQQQRERQQRAEASNRAREEHHSLIMSRVSAEQRALEEARRNAILAKEDKMRRLQQRREQAVHESRTQAYTTAELRDQIKRTMSPETFDRLVARSALEARVTASRTPLTGSPPSCTRSHILLG